MNGSPNRNGVSVTQKKAGERPGLHVESLESRPPSVHRVSHLSQRGPWEDKKERRKQRPLPLPPGPAHMRWTGSMLTAIRTGPSDSLRNYGLRGADSLSRSAIRKCGKTHTATAPFVRKETLRTNVIILYSPKIGRAHMLRAAFIVHLITLLPSHARAALLIGPEVYGSEIGQLANPHNDLCAPCTVAQRSRVRGCRCA
jgi:hypothetical protein